MLGDVDDSGSEGSKSSEEKERIELTHDMRELKSYGIDPFKIGILMFHWRTRAKTGQIVVKYISQYSSHVLCAHTP